MKKHKKISLAVLTVLGMFLLAVLVYFLSYAEHIKISISPKSLTEQMESTFFVFVFVICSGIIALIIGIVSKKSQKN